MVATNSAQKIYHTFFAEFSGATAGDVLRDMHKYSHRGTGESFSEWWARQKSLWNAIPNTKVPDIGTPQAEEKLLSILVEVGALEEGPLKPAAPAPGG